MSKSNKELAVDVAIEYIRAHQKQIIVLSLIKVRFQPELWSWL